jgi:hypothetical protein
MIAKLIPASRWKHTRLTYYLVLAGWVFYAFLTFLSPDTFYKAHSISPTAIDFVRITVLVLILVIMLLAARGATAFKSYAIMIAGSKEGQAIDLIADGLLLTLSYFLITTIFGALLPFYTQSPGYNALVVIRDHIPVVISLAAYFVIYRGSDQLRRVAKFETWTRGAAFVMVAFMVFSFVFVLEYTRFQAPPPIADEATAMTILPLNLLLFTLILPFLLAWFLGILATINIFKFSNQVQGKLYRLALKDLIKGLWFVIILSMLIQFLSLSDKYLVTLKLPILFGIIYVLLILYGIGFMFVRAGAKRLSALEEAG